MGCLLRKISEPITFPLDAISRLDLPTVASWAVTGVHVCHFFGRALSRLELRQEQPGLYLAGVLMNAHYGDVTFLKVTAQIVRIARVLFETIEEGGRLVHSCNRFAAAVLPPKLMTMHYANNRILHEEWPTQEGLAPPFLFLPWPLALIAMHIVVVAMRIAEVASAIWRVNLCLFDLYDAVWMNPHTQSAAIDDLFIDLGGIAEGFVSRERRLSQAVARHAQWIDELLHLAKVDWTANSLSAVLNGFADQAEGLKSICEGPGQALATMVKGTATIATGLTTNLSSNSLSEKILLRGRTSETYS